MELHEAHSVDTLKETFKRGVLTSWQTLLFGLEAPPRSHWVVHMLTNLLIYHLTDRVVELGKGNATSRS